MKIVACYVRVSSVGQNEKGQKAAIEEWIKAHGLKDVEYFIDKKTGDNLDRPAFKRMEAAIFAGKVSAVVVWKLDRLSRSLRDGINTLADWCERGIRIVSVTQQLDFSGPIGKLLASVFFAIAELEQETRRERQAVGIANAKKNGIYIGRKKGTTKGQPERAKELAAKGLNHTEIKTAMGVSRRTVIRYLAV